MILRDDISIPEDVAIDPTRRRLLANGALMVAFTLAPRLASAQVKKGNATTQMVTEAGTMTIAAPGLPGSLATTPLLDAWIKIDVRGRVTVFTGKAELGTGVRTALIQIAAEELALAPGSFAFITADTSLTPNEGYTAGSHTLADSGTALFNAAAQVRGLLVQAAAKKLAVDASKLKVSSGVIRTADGRRVTYGEAVRSINLHQNAQPVSPATDPKTFRVIGKSVLRVDIPAKVTGRAAYVQDLRLPGMLHARVVRPPSYGAKLAAFDSRVVEKMIGVLKVMRDGNYLAVIADDEWHAILAMRALSASARWIAGPALPAQATIHETLMRMPSQDIVDANRTNATTPPAVHTLHARFTRPFLSHGSIGPSCAVALLDKGKMTVWTHTQGVFPLRGGLAEMLSMPVDDVRCVHMEGSGCYGHNGADDAAADAALIARAMPGRPVRVQLMRDQEQTWEPYSPAMTTEISASLDASGKICDWRYVIWSNSHNQRIDNAGRLIPAQLLSKPFTPAPPVPIPMPEGEGDRNSIPLYTLPNLHVLFHFLPIMPLRVSAMRSLGAHMNVFTIESVMDELAALAQTDPVEFRLKHLDDQRGRAVICLAAERFGWSKRPSGKPGHGVGFAFAQYKNLMAYVAIAVELSVERDTGKVTIGHVVAAVDCGQIVNPDGVRNQIEGGILQTTSCTMFEQVNFDTKNITSYDWSTYPIMRFPSLPATVEVTLLDRPGMPFLGVGEAAQGPMAAALANALASATGKRFRNMPLAATIEM